MKREVQKLDISNKRSLTEFLQAPTSYIAESLTDMLSSKRDDLKLSAGKLVQSALKVTLLSKLGNEIKGYQKEGRVKKDYLSTPKNANSLYELLKFLDEKIPDEELFGAIKSIFLTGISSGATAQEEVLAYEFSQIAQRLSGTEVLILKANFDIAHGKNVSPNITYSNTDSRNVWKRVVAKQMGYGDMYSIVEKYEKNLEALCLIVPRNEMDRLQGSYEQTKWYRLTEMGNTFCEFMTKYPKEKGENDKHGK